MYRALPLLFVWLLLWAAGQPLCAQYHKPQDRQQQNTDPGDPDSDTTAAAQDEAPLPKDGATAGEQEVMQLLEQIQMEPTMRDSAQLAHQVKRMRVAPDTAALRPVSDARLAELRNDPAFEYGPRVDMERSLWEMFLEWLAEMLRPDNDGEQINPEDLQVGEDRANTVLIVILAVVLLLLILTRFNLKAIFYKKGAKSDLQFTEEEEDIHAENLPNLLAEALAAKDFRRAIRLRYLSLLKRLSDQNSINWKPEKTNFDYLYELRPQPARALFREAVTLFEFPWYGKYEAQRQHFDRLNFLAGEVERMAERATPTPITPNPNRQ